MILRELQKQFGEIYLGREKNIYTDMFFILANITTNCQMVASVFEWMLYTMLSEEPFVNHRLDMTDENEEYAISDYMSQNFAITIGETWTFLTCKIPKSPKIFMDLSFILSLEQMSKKGKNTRIISHEKKTHLWKSCVTMIDMMVIFYETKELSHVICDTCTKSSVTIKKYNFEKKQSVLKAPMQLRISLQRSHYNEENDTFCKNKTKNPFQHNIPCPFQTTLK